VPPLSSHHPWSNSQKLDPSLSRARHTLVCLEFGASFLEKELMDLLGALDREKEVMGLLLLLTVWSLRSRK
jgi:hypothetical protein